jgi:hypothetical protein
MYCDNTNSSHTWIQDWLVTSHTFMHLSFDSEYIFWPASCNAILQIAARWPCNTQFAFLGTCAFQTRTKQSGPPVTITFDSTIPQTICHTHFFHNSCTVSYKVTFQQKIIQQNSKEYELKTIELCQLYLSGDMHDPCKIQSLFYI